MVVLKSYQREDVNQTKDGYDFGDIRTRGKKVSHACLKKALSKHFWTASSCTHVGRNKHTLSQKYKYLLLAFCIWTHYSTKHGT